jgi:beta-galactosidase
MKAKFPNGFLWGTAISAFQTEGGVSKEADFPGIDWYPWTHSPEMISKKLVSGDLPENGDGFWDLYEEDMKRAVDLGTNSIRLSVEWGKIFRESTESVEAKVRRNSGGDVFAVDVDDVCFAGLSKIAHWDTVEHYRKMLAWAKRLGLKVLLTISHFSLPLWIHDPLACHHDLQTASRKGWLDQKTVVEFGKYADFAGRVFSEHVDIWETINEPEVVAAEGYLSRGFPPALSDPQLAFRAERNMAFAHSVGYRNLKKHSPDKPVGIAIARNARVPADDDPRSRKVAEYATYVTTEWILNALIYGAFDNDFDMVAEEHAEGMSGSDYLGLDYYNRIRVRHSEEKDRMGLHMETLPCVDCTDFHWDIYPEGIRSVSRWMHEKYRLPIYILENGLADSKDEKRARYIRAHLKELADAINIDGVPIKGYYHWSLLGNFEWGEGYSMRFGLYAVDFETKAREKRKSAEVFEQVCKTGELEY